MTIGVSFQFNGHPSLLFGQGSLVVLILNVDMFIKWCWLKGNAQQYFSFLGVLLQVHL
jgi:hypothetical protein